MSKIIKSSRENLIREALDKFIAVESILDIGCGIMGNLLFYAPIYYGCDPCEEYINVLKDKIKDKDDRIYIVDKMGWQDVVQEFPKRSVDTVLLIDVIEHLDKKTGERLLKETEQIARQQIIIFTPLDYIEQKRIDGKDAWGLGGADYQEHKSVWKPDDFGDGWECLVCEDFHEYNNIGEKLAVPVGAFFAIKYNSKELYQSRVVLNKIEALNTYIKNTSDNRAELSNKIAEGSLREEYLLYQVETFENEIKILENKNKELENINIELENHNSSLIEKNGILNNKLNEIYNSNGWKVLSSYYKLRDWKRVKLRR